MKKKLQLKKSIKKVLKEINIRPSPGSIQQLEPTFTTTFEVKIVSKFKMSAANLEGAIYDFGPEEIIKVDVEPIE